jgi:hypothetical protein
MPFTPKYGLPFEQTPTDEPGRTLHGGVAGTSDILAEEVETELVRIDGDVNEVDTRVGVLEDRVTRLDRQIFSGEVGTGTDLVVPDHLRGLFTWYTLIVDASVGVSGAALVVRINNDTGENHRATCTSWNAAGTVQQSDDRNNTNFPRTGFLGSDGPPSPYVIDFIPRSFPNTGFIAWVGRGWANHGLSGSRHVISGGRWNGASTELATLRVRTNVISHEWSPQSRATLFGRV